MTAASAYPPHPQQGASEGRGSEPSMEDILASIRRIIADDQANGGRSGSRRSPPAALADTSPNHGPATDEEVLDLARFAAAPGHATAHDVAIPMHGEASPVVDHAADHHDHDTFQASGFDPHGADHSAPLAQEEHRHLTDDGDFDRETEGGALMSAPMGESVMSAFEALAATVILENKPMLERVLRDLLRPMLKTWLDDNLPSLVERLVRNEIERVARGGRS